LVIGALHAWLLQPLVSEHRLLTEQVKIDAATSESLQSPEAEEIYIFDMLSDVIPWLMENAELAGVSVAAITQTPAPEGLLLDLRGGFPQAAAFIERVLHGTNLMVQSPLLIAPVALKAVDLQLFLQLTLVPLVCLKRCKEQPPIEQDIRAFNDGFVTKKQLETVAAGHVLQNVSVEQMKWVGHLALMTDNYELVQMQHDDVVLVASRNRFGVEKVTVEGLPGWGDGQ
jgi:hypothetical protein